MLLLSLAEQHPLFQKTGPEPAPTPATPVKAGLQTKGYRSPAQKEETSPKRKTTGRAYPKKPVHPLRQDTPADPTHEKLLAVLSNAARLPDAGEGGTTMACADSPSADPGDTNMPPTAESAAGWPPRQATSSHLPAHQYVTHGHIQYRVTEDGTHEHLPPPRAFAHPKKCPVQ